MRIVIFCHSLISDWNHGNAHFLRGVVAELQGRRHDVTVYEPADGWSRRELLADAGASAVNRFHHAFPSLTSQSVDLDRLSRDEALGDADLVMVHEWNPHALIERIGRHKSQGGTYTLLFHDTHHRSVTDVESMAAYDLQHYDGVLAFGEVIRERYMALGWSRRAWTWHEAADTRTFMPHAAAAHQDDLVWIGNWGDGERSAELRAYLIGPVRDLSIQASVYGVRYPAEARLELAGAEIHYGGWLPNYDAPFAYARHKMTIHVPRRPYVEALPGIPTIRVFEALACGVSLASVAWQDVEGLFTAGDDFLVAHTPDQMRTHLRALMQDEALRRSLAAHGLETIRRRHTCAHRVDELMGILQELRRGTREETLSI
jgi:spore maturation protein CgeB